MQFNIIDAEATYRRLLAAPDAATREAIFRDELVAPFSGLSQRFGSDAMTMFAQWGMSPDQFGDANRARMRQVVDTMTAHDAWGQAAQSLEEGRAAFARYADRIPLATVVFGLYLADLSNAPWSRGYTGFGGFPGWIMTVYGDPDPYNLARIKPCTVHELHHNIFGAVYPDKPMIATVGEYMIGEGLAESFAGELYGADLIGPWVTEFDETRLEETKRRFKDALYITGFNEVRQYIFGDIMGSFGGRPSLGIPAHAGYALGYRVVQAYLARTGQSVVDATFVSPWEIIEASRFF